MSEMSMPRENAIKQLLDRVYHFKKASDEAKSRLADRFAPDFNMFDFLRQDEMGVSNVLAFLLNPKGKHGQRDAFLRLFFEYLQIDGFDSEAEWTVSTEKQANGQRRIDVYLESTNAVLAIENKPWGIDQDKQLSDYADFIKKQKKENWLLIYLCNSEPSKESIPKAKRESLENSKNMLCVDFFRLVRWLDRCSEVCKAANIRAFIEDFTRFVRIHVNGDFDMSDTKEIVDSILASDESVESAFLVSSLLSDVKRRLLCQLKEDLEGLVKDNNMILVWDKGLDEGNFHTYVGFGVKICDEEDDVYLRVQFEGVELSSANWGLAHVNKDDKALAYKERPDYWGSIGKLMKDKYPVWGDGKNNKWWVGWAVRGSFFEPYGRDFGKAPRFWLSLRNGGEFAKKFINLAIEVRAIFFSEADKLSLLKKPNV